MDKSRTLGSDARSCPEQRLDLVSAPRRYRSRTLHRKRREAGLGTGLATQVHHFLANHMAPLDDRRKNFSSIRFSLAHVQLVYRNMTKAWRQAERDSKNISQELLWQTQRFPQPWKRGRTLIAVRF